MIVIGECAPKPWQTGPYNNTVTGTTFIKLGRAGGWYRQDTSSSTASQGNLGPNNVISDCDVVRLHGTNLIYQTNDVLNMSTLSIHDVRVTSPNFVFLYLNQSTPIAVGGVYEISNVSLPASGINRGYIGPAGWRVVLRNVTVGGVLATSDAQLNLTTHYPSTTTYLAY